MKDATTELRIAYLSLLANLVVNNETIPIYDTIVNDSTPPYSADNPPQHYIILSNQNQTDESNKCIFVARHSIQVTVYTWYPVNQGGTRLSEQIDEAIKERILTNTAGRIPLTGFNCYRSRIDLSRADTEFTKTNNIYKRITIFNHSIQQL